MKLDEISESKHEELSALVNPLIDFMVANGYTYFLVAGKDGTCTRHLRGDYYDLHGMLNGMSETQPQVGLIFNEIVQDNIMKSKIGKGQWIELRNEFFLECVDDGIKININPHNLFDWFKERIKKFEKQNLADQ